jgi:adenine-specific DNA-methyltransferase
MSERPQSNFSKKSQSQLALERLLNALSTAGAKVIFTFPAGECSNGLSGQIVINTARTWFDVEERLIGGQFSTLGGNNNHRASRKPSSELLLLLWPKVQRNS